MTRAHAFLLTMFASGAVPIGCGGRLLTDIDANTTDAGDAGEEDAYTGEWCNPETGPADGPGGGAVFCEPAASSYEDGATLPTFCEFSIGGTSRWWCCGRDWYWCCPGTVNPINADVGNWTECCREDQSETDCSACCNGIYPGSYFTNDK